MEAIQFDIPSTLYSGPNTTGVEGSIFAAPPRKSRFGIQITLNAPPSGAFAVELQGSLDGVNFFVINGATDADFGGDSTFILNNEPLGAVTHIRFAIIDDGDTGATIVAIINFAKAAEI